MSKIRALVALLLTSALTLTACGENTDGSTPPDPALQQDEETNELPRAMKSDPLTARSSCRHRR